MTHLPTKGIKKLYATVCEEKGYWNKRLKALYTVPVKDRTREEFREIEMCKGSLLYIDGKLHALDTILNPTEFERKIYLGE